MGKDAGWMDVQIYRSSLYWDGDNERHNYENPRKCVRTRGLLRPCNWGF